MLNGTSNQYVLKVLISHPPPMLAHSMATRQDRDIGSDLSVHGALLVPALRALAV